MISLISILICLAMDTLAYPVYILDEIVVTATRTPTLIKNLAIPVTVITAKEIEGINLKDIGDILEYALSTKVEKYGGLGAMSGLFMRGLYSSRVIVLVDGRPINSPSLGSADLSWISGTGIDRVEIIRGPISSLYGANALGGVVNIITKKEPENRLTLCYSSWNTIISANETGGTFGNFKYLVTGTYRKSDGERDNSAHDSKEMRGKIDYRFGGFNFVFQSGFYQGRTGWPGVKPAEDTTKRTLSQLRLGNDEVSSLYDFGRDKRFFCTARINFQNLIVSGFVNNWDDDAHREWIERNWTTFQEERHISDDNYKTKFYGIEIQDSRRLWNNLFTYGTSFTKDRFEVRGREHNLVTDSVKFTKWDATRSTSAIYLQDEIEFTSLRSTIGVRWDNPSDYRAQISLRASLAYKFSETIKLIASYGNGFRAPTLNDLYWPADPFAEGNPNLKPEKGECYELGLENLLLNKILSRVTVFKQATYDMIAWAPLGPVGPYGNKWVPSNINRVKTKGIEVEINIGLVKDLNTSIKYAYLNSVQRNRELVDYVTNKMEIRERRTAYIPEHKIDFGVEYKIKGFRVNLDAQYVYDTYNYYAKYHRWPDTRVSMDTKLNPGYRLIRTKLSKKVWIANLSVGVDNLLNEKYYKFGYSMEDQGYPLPGRSFRLEMSCTF